MKKEANNNLFKIALEKAHNNDINDMYNYINSRVDNLEAYGDTPEKMLINYFKFKPDIARRLYR